MTALSGMKEICDYCRRSEATVLRWIRELDFPASKLGGGSWESDSVEIDTWRRLQVGNGQPAMETPPPKKRGRRTRRAVQKQGLVDDFS